MRNKKTLKKRVKKSLKRVKKSLKHVNKNARRTRKVGGRARHNFKTIRNNGKAENDYENQCIWISIRDYIVHYLGFENISVTKLREIARTNPSTVLNHRKSSWDSEFNLNALLYISLLFGLHIYIYDVQGGFLQTHGQNEAIMYSDLNEIKRYAGIIGYKGIDPELVKLPLEYQDIQKDKNREVYIASYGDHFELITDIVINDELYHIPTYEEDNNEEFRSPVPIISDRRVIDYETVFSKYFATLSIETRNEIKDILRRRLSENEATMGCSMKHSDESKVESKEEQLNILENEYEKLMLNNQYDLADEFMNQIIELREQLEKLK